MFYCYSCQRAFEEPTKQDGSDPFGSDAQRASYTETCPHCGSESIISGEIGSIHGPAVSHESFHQQNENQSQEE